MATTTEHTAYSLARLADCGAPDSGDSAGAHFLISVQDSVIDLAGEWTEDTAHEIADDAPSVYTHEVWTQFVDLAAYNEDPTEFGCDASDMEQCAKVCLYIIAERLALELANEMGLI